MRIALLCATRRGLLVLQKLKALAGASELHVFSFREEPWEPLFMEAIQQETEQGGGTFYEARQVGAPKWRSFWETTPPDLLLAVSWRYMIPPEAYQRARLGAFVFHDSLLPAYRGFAPTVWAIINGVDHTGATLFRIAPEVDDGEILDQQRVQISSEETISLVMEKVTQAYLQLLERNLPNMLAERVVSRPQESSQATYCCRRIPTDNEINWNNSSKEIFNLVRAVTAPYPGAWTRVDGRKLTIWEIRPALPSRSYVGPIPGRVVEIRPGMGVVVLTGDGSVLITRVQFEGGVEVNAADAFNSLSTTLGK